MPNSPKPWICWLFEGSAPHGYRLIMRGQFLPPACGEGQEQDDNRHRLHYSMRMIEKVGYSRPATAAGRANAARSTQGAGGTEFAEALSRAEGVVGASGIETASPVAALTGAGALLGIQEVSEDETRRRKAVRRGRLTLDALAQLRDAMLIGSLPLSTLE